MVAFAGRMLVAEDEPLVVKGLRRGLLRGWDVVVCDAVADAQSVLEHEAIDAALFDLRLADGWTHGLIRWAATSRPGLPIGVQSVHADGTLQRELEPLGVVVAQKPASRAQLGSFLTRAGWRALAGEDRPWTVLAAWAERHSLSLRESCAMVLALRGLTNRDIGLALGIEAETVKEHLQRVFDKTGCRSRLALSWALLGEAARNEGPTPAGGRERRELCRDCRYGRLAEAEQSDLVVQCTQGRLPRYPRLPVTGCEDFVDAGPRPS